MIRSGWVVAFEDGSRMSATEEGETLEVHAGGLTHRVDRSSRLYPWHRVHEIEWKSSETERRKPWSIASGSTGVLSSHSPDLPVVVSVFVGPSSTSTTPAILPERFASGAR